VTDEQIERERERFEAWFFSGITNPVIQFKPNGTYRDPLTQYSFQAWLARAQEAERRTVEKWGKQ
jgi:hypothetical protein